ncbi:hypothetical protein NJB1907Z4_C26680 [Mycobacterium pseudoshottsii]|uniref:Uncharacterized protein n=1 Tax=Mycobacterium pseudoshottsii TaxID=265949 RepID=A0A9N7LTQ7_9MYCO|nr:hypothetical protein NJB1907Z4_C26680 [Mycobacterium pseudoshottsii]
MVPAGRAVTRVWVVLVEPAVAARSWVTTASPGRARPLAATAVTVGMGPMPAPWVPAVVLVGLVVMVAGTATVVLVVLVETVVPGVLVATVAVVLTVPS